MVGLLFLLVARGSAAYLPSACTKDGGTTQCSAVDPAAPKYTAGYGNYCVPGEGSSVYPTEAEAAARADREFACHYASGPNVCTYWTVTGPAWIPDGNSCAGIPVRDTKGFTGYFTWSSPPPAPACSNTSWDTGGLVRDTGPACPAGWNLQKTCVLETQVCWREAKPEAACKGNPCVPNSGAKLEFATDYTGAGPFPLEIRRHYNSQGFVRPVGIQGGDYGLGLYWRLSYHRAVTIGTTGTLGNIAQVTHADGDYRDFRLVGGVWVGRADSPERLVQLTGAGGATTGWQYTIGDDEVSAFDADGRLTSITKRNGLTQTMGYDATGRLTSVTDSFGRQLTFVYNGAGQLVSATDPEGRTYAYAFNAGNDLTTVTYPDADVREYLYENRDPSPGGSILHLLTGILDENGQRYATYAYDASGRLVSEEHAGGANRMTFAYTINGNGGIPSTNITDALGTMRTHSFVITDGISKDAGLSQACPGCNGNAFKAITYDTNGNVASRTDFNDRKVCFGYDLARNLETTRVEGLLAGESCTTALGSPPARPDVRKITTTWHATYRLPLVVTEPAAGGTGVRTTTHTYVAGNLTQKSITGPKNDGTGATTTRTWKWSYGSLGRVLTATDPNNRVTTTTYYADDDPDLGRRGNVATVSNPKGHVTSITGYDAHGRALTIADPNGLVTTVTYSPRGWLATRTVGGELTTYSYDGVGQLTGVSSPDGSTLAYAYDAAHRLTQVQDGLGNKIVYTLDAMGNRIREDVYDPSATLARTRSRAYDGLNRVVADIGAQAQTTSYLYDNNGNRTRSTDPLAHATNSSYDALNRLLTVLDPAGGSTVYGYDAGGNLATVTDPRSLTTTYTYDGLGNQTKQVSPDTGTSVRTFDAAGNVKTALDARGVTATYTYDVINRVTKVVYSQAGQTSETHTYVYDGGTAGAPNAKGRLTKLTDPAATTTWSYTAQGRIATAAQKVGTLTQTISYDYNAAGQRSSITTPSGQVIGLTYLNNRVLGITLNGAPLIQGVVTTPFAAIGAWQWANGNFTFREQDQDGRLTRWEHRNGTSVARNDLTWDVASRITAITDPAQPATNGAFGYDTLDRLNLAQIGNPITTTQQFGYDAVGNRTNLTVNSALTNYAYGSTANQLLALSGASSRNYTYDGAGNPTLVNGRTHTYNLANRLTKLTDGATVVATYKVNALGQRISKTVGSTTTRFVYDDQGRLLGEYDNAGKIIQETIWLEDLPVATLRPTGATGTPAPVNVYYVHADHLGSPRAVTRPGDHAMLWRWDNADPFGANAANENPAGLGAFSYNLRFPGQYYDAETGTHYNYFRDYDPTIGRYVQSDPIGLGGGLNTYGYVFQQPLRLVDRLGLEVYFCNRAVRIPGMPGNHSYFWDSRNGRCCGRDQGNDPIGNCNERGPNGGDSCNLIPDSGGKEDDILKCCNNEINWGWWFPYANDCHRRANQCLAKLGITNPGPPGGRMGDCDSCSKGSGSTFSGAP